MLRAWSHVPSLAAGSMGQLCWLLGEHLCRMEPSQVTAWGEQAGKPAQH